MEVTCRTVGGLALLRPSRKLPEIIAGVLGRALELSPLEICGLSFASNHYHILLYAENQQAISRFMAHIQCNLAKEVGRHVGWKGSMWSRRFDGIIVSREPKAQWARPAYVLAHGTKEGLVASPLEWPGLHAARYLITGEPIVGYWFNRTREWAATRRGEDFGTYDYATRYEIPLAPLPCARHLSVEEYQDEVIQLVEKIQNDCAKARKGRPVAGVEAILKQKPFERPTLKRPKRSPKPRFHVASKASALAKNDPLVLARIDPHEDQVLSARSSSSSGHRGRDRDFGSSAVMTTRIRLTLSDPIIQPQGSLVWSRGEQRGLPCLGGLRKCCK